MIQCRDFTIGDKVVYPSHGVGEVQSIETQELQGSEIKVYVVLFNEKRMTVRIPFKKASSLRNLVNRSELENAYATLRSKAQVTSKVGSKRNQDLDMKLKSGNLVLIAEVLRDLYKSKNHNKDRSYSERLIYESAISKLGAEVAAVDQIPLEKAVQRLLDILEVGC